MKEIETFKLDENEERLIELLQRFNYSHIDAKILTYMLKKKKAIAKQIERDVDLRQPEVSIGINRLIAQGIIGKTETRTPGKGRPAHEYHLKMKPNTIRMHVIKRADEQIAKKVAWLEETKAILNKIEKS